MAFSFGAVFWQRFCLAVVDANLRRIPEGLNEPTGHQESSLSVAQQSFGVQARWRGARQECLSSSDLTDSTARAHSSVLISPKEGLAGFCPRSWIGPPRHRKA